MKTMGIDKIYLITRRLDRIKLSINNDKKEAYVECIIPVSTDYFTIYHVLDYKVPAYSGDTLKSILKRVYKVIDDHREEWESAMVKGRIY